MAIKSYLLPLLTATTLGTVVGFSQPSVAQSVDFVCDYDNSNIFTTYAETPNGSIPVFKWTSNYFRPPYTPQQRCVEVSDRMNRFRDQGQLEFLTSGVVNRLPVICAGRNCDPGGSNVLITLKPNQNPNQVLEELEANRSGAGGPSNQFAPSLGTTLGNLTRPRAVSRNANGTVTLNMTRYLQNTPPETRSSTSQTPQPTQNSPVETTQPTQNPSPAPQTKPETPDTIEIVPGISIPRRW